MSETRELHHSIDAKHAQNIGEQSVSDRVQAIIEIVKNSYDADALNCTVRFFGRLTYDGSRTNPQVGQTTLLNLHKIVVTDDGTGMTLDDIKNKWMRLATDSKMKETESKKFGRRVSGQKGMGHFATQKLGSKVIIISNPEDDDKTFMLSTNWDEYIPGKSFDEIPNKLQIEPRNDELNQKLYACKHGLTIEITNLKETWTLEDVEKVRLHLGALQIPKFLMSTEKNVFHADVKSEGFDLTGDSENKDITDYATWTLEAHLRGGKINYKITELDKNTLKKSVPADGIVKTLPRGSHIPAIKPVCGDADFLIYYYPGRGKASRSIGGQGKLDLDYGWIPRKLVKNKENLAALLQSNAGVKIFHDNIRIRPYGDPRRITVVKGKVKGVVNDWLGLGARRFRYGFQSLGPEQTIGYVLLKRENNPYIEETTTRQALVENDAFRSLKNDFVLESMTVLEKYVQQRREQVEEKRKSASPTAKAVVETKQLEEYLNDLDLPKNQKNEATAFVKNIQKHAVQAEKEKKEDEERYESKIEMYRNLSSLGISALAFHHEIMQPLSRISEGQDMLIEFWNKWDDDKKRDYVRMALSDIDTVRDLNSYIKTYASLFTGSKGSRRKKEEINPKKVIEDIEHGFKKLLDEYHIDFSVGQTGGNYDGLWMHIASFQSIMLNLIGNSINTLQNVSRKEKWIKIEIEKENNHLKIRVSDNGFGILADHWDDIFDPLHTTKRLGTGMGLTIVKEIIEEDYGGTIIVESSVSEEEEKGFGETTFLISIPLRELKKEAK